MTLFSSPSSSGSAAAARLPLLDALRAFGALSIMLHHFALYAPLRDLAAPLAGGLLDWLEAHARTTQIFFVASGFVLARSLDRHRWNLARCGSFLVQRYCRLGLPYLCTIALVLAAYAFAHDTLPDEVLGSALTPRQLLAHLAFVQDIVGEEQLSAGFWFVCINFQLGLIYVLTLCLRDTLQSRRSDAATLLGWGLAAFSLFHFNLVAGNDAWALYFFPYFFMGVVVQRAVRPQAHGAEFWGYQAVFAAALMYNWRWRLVIAMVVGLVLYVAERRGWAARWPKNRTVAALGRISYSLFLLHFPVLIVVATIWLKLGWTSPPAALAGLGVAAVASIAGAALYHRLVEKPAAWLARTLTMPPRAPELSVRATA